MKSTASVTSADHDVAIMCTRSSADRPVWCRPALLVLNADRTAIAGGGENDNDYYS